MPLHASEHQPNHYIMDLERNFCYSQVIPFDSLLTMPSPL